MPEHKTAWWNTATFGLASPSAMVTLIDQGWADSYQRRETPQENASPTALFLLVIDQTIVASGKNRNFHITAEKAPSRAIHFAPHKQNIELLTKILHAVVCVTGARCENGNLDALACVLENDCGLDLTQKHRSAISVMLFHSNSAARNVRLHYEDNLRSLTDFPSVAAASRPLHLRFFLVPGNQTRFFFLFGGGKNVAAQNV